MFKFKGKITVLSILAAVFFIFCALPFLNNVKALDLNTFNEGAPAGSAENPVNSSQKLQRVLDLIKDDTSGKTDFEIWVTSFTLDSSVCFSNPKAGEVNIKFKPEGGGKVKINVKTAPLSDEEISGNPAKGFLAFSGAAGKMTFDFKNIVFDGLGQSTGISFYDENEAGGAPAGLLTIKNAAFSNFSGAVFMDRGGDCLKMEDCCFENCISYNGGALYIKNGGAEIIRTAFRSCGAKINGGAVYGENAELTISDVTFYKCGAGAGGGAVYSEYGSVSCSSVDFSGNYAASGGAVYSVKLAGFTADAKTVFAENTAAKPAQWQVEEAINLSDLGSLHKRNIKTTRFTEPFENAYNNCDIAVEYTPAPVIGDVKTGSESISGNGIPGAKIMVLFDENSAAHGEVNKNGRWSVDVPFDVELFKDEIITVYQAETDKIGSFSEIKVGSMQNNVSNSPQTGGKENLILYLNLFMASLTLLVVFGKKRIEKLFKKI